MSAVTGRVFVAQNPEQFTYDADGNMTCDCRFRYTWNGENRLIRAQELVAPTNRNPYTLTYAYDHRGRMVSKRITENDGNDTLVKSVSYLWDGWNIIREIQWPVASGQWPVVTDNVWGLDLDGTLQGAGGVGGLLAVQRSDCAATNSAFCILHSALYLPTYDANGNVSEYVSTDGSIVAHYDYSPFGEMLIESGDLASIFTHRFSTKPWCSVTGLCEYQMRKYRPEIGRWMSRDPIGEALQRNVFSFIHNESVAHIDYIGLIAIPIVGTLFGGVYAGIGAAFGNDNMVATGGGQWNHMRGADYNIRLPDDVHHHDVHGMLGQKMIDIDDMTKKVVDGRGNPTSVLDYIRQLKAMNCCEGRR